MCSFLVFINILFEFIFVLIPRIVMAHILYDIFRYNAEMINPMYAFNFFICVKKKVPFACTSLCCVCRERERARAHVSIYFSALNKLTPFLYYIGSSRYDAVHPIR